MPNTSAPQKITEAEVNAKFASWNASLAEGYKATQKNDYSGHGSGSVVADQYAETEADQGVLLPTVKYAVCTDRAAITSYFDHFVPKNPVGKVVPDETRIETGPTIAVQGGAYDFSLTDPETKEISIVPCHFTFVSKRMPDGSLKFIHHHSSMKAQAADAPVLDKMVDSIETSYTQMGGAATKGNDMITSEAATLARYNAALDNALSSKSFKKACADDNSSIEMDQTVARPLDDGYMMHVGHLKLVSEDKNGVTTVTDHRFTMIFNENGKCVRKQISKSPENPNGVKLEPTTGSVPSPSPSQGTHLTK